MSDYSIEAKDSPHGEKWAVYEWGVYPQSSVLAGQTMKRFVEWFDQLRCAQDKYPDAPVGYRDAHNTYSHLPGEDDPVPGGMYPDDIGGVLSCCNGCGCYYCEGD